MSVVADDIGAIQDVAHLQERCDVLEMVGHLVDAVDEGERAHPAELGRHRLEQRQREGCELGHRSGHVAEEIEVGPGHLRVSKDRVEQDATSRKRPSDGTPHVKPAAIAPSASPRHLRGERSRQWPDRLAHRGQLARRRAQEIDLVRAQQFERTRCFVGPACLGELVPDLGGDKLLEGLDSLGKLGAQRALVHARLPGLQPLGGQHLGHQPRQFERAQDPIQEVPLRGTGLRIQSTEALDGQRG